MNQERRYKLVWIDDKGNTTVIDKFYDRSGETLTVKKCNSRLSANKQSFFYTIEITKGGEEN